MSKNIVFEGWLTKSPPSKRIWRTKWRRRWFALRQSGELPGQYFLDYFADRNCRRLKGTINLDLCEQVDAGLHMERGNGALAPKDRGSVFTIQTQTRIYHLEADCEADMEKWVDAICRVCGLRATDSSSNLIGPYQNEKTSVSITEEQPYDSDKCPGVYIPISECVTGARAQVLQNDYVQDRQAFTFDIDFESCRPMERLQRPSHIYHNNPKFRITNADTSENESSNISDDDSSSQNADENRRSRRDFASAKRSFKKLAVNPNLLAPVIPENGPPVPPRPPKTMVTREMQQIYTTMQARKIPEPNEYSDGSSLSWNRRAAPPSPLRSVLHSRSTDDEEEHSPGHQSLQYCNLGFITVTQPPAVDRALKPKPQPKAMSQQPIAAACVLYNTEFEDNKIDAIQYLDLDLPAIPPSNAAGGFVIHGKSSSDVESVYRCVDILKTEAFNSTREDAEASRSFQE